VEDANLAKCCCATPHPTMVAIAMMQKVLCNNKNGKKPDLNKNQFATLHTRICISTQS
jgi:hypothetical protein